MIQLRDGTLSLFFSYDNNELNNKKNIFNIHYVMSPDSKTVVFLNNSPRSFPMLGNFCRISWELPACKQIYIMKVTKKNHFRLAKCCATNFKEPFSLFKGSHISQQILFDFHIQNCATNWGHMNALFHTASAIALSRSFRKLDSSLRAFAVLLQSSAEFAPCHVCTTSSHLCTSFSLRDMISTRRSHIASGTEGNEGNLKQNPVG